MMKVAVLYDFVPHRHPFSLGIEKASGWQVEERGAIFPRKITKLSKLCCLFPLTVWVPIRFLFEIRRFKKVFCWQQNYGILLGLLIRLFGLPVSAEIYILTFIATGKRREGVAARIINYAVGCRNVRKVICYNRAELELYCSVFPALKGKLVTTLLAEEFPGAESFPSSDSGFYLAAGRSNRDYKFLLDYFAIDKSRSLHIVSDTLAADLQTDNVKIFNNLFHEDYFRKLACCRGVIVAFEDATISSGQMVFLHALQLGKPIVATRSECLDGYMRNGWNGIEIEKDFEQLALALSRLDDPSVANTISDNQKRDHRARFCFESMGFRLFEISNC